MENAELIKAVMEVSKSIDGLGVAIFIGLILHAVIS